jgi:hypothetical protein
MKGINIAEQCHVVNVLPPIDAASTARTGDWFNLKNYAHCTLIVTLGASEGGIALTVDEATNSSGSSNAAITFDYWAETTAAGDTLAAKVTATAGGFVIGSANSQTFVIEIDASKLTDGKPYMSLQLDNGGTAGCLYSCVAVLSGSRFAQAQTPTAIT